MKKPLFTILFLASIASAVSQNNDYIRARYQLTYKPSKTYKDIIKKEEMLLLINKDSSTFISLGKYLIDSVFSKPEEQIVLEDLTRDFIKYHTEINEVVKKDHQSGKIIVITEIISGFVFKYKEDLHIFQWIIDPEKKIINGYQCQKATTHFAGRDYIAWFTNEIPISDGPYKFNGLPGLIIEIYDTDDHYHYALTSFKESKMPNVIYERKKDYFEVNREVDKKEFFRIKESYSYKSIMPNIEAKGITIDKEIKNIMEQIINNSDNPIELIEF